MTRYIRVWEVGLMKYLDAYNLQKVVAARHIKVSERNPLAPPDTLLLVEHPPVYTIGIRTSQYGADEAARLVKLGAEFHRTNRGGLITFHGPGQLVAYPIINLKTFGLGIRDYVCRIERTVMETCRELGVSDVYTSEEPNETGVWVNNSKICAIGVHASRYVTTHGLALNCNTDLSWYDHIVPCGIVGKGITSLSKQLSRNVSVQEVVSIFLQAFCQHFQCAAQNFPKVEKSKILQSISAQDDGR